MTFSASISLATGSKKISGAVKSFVQSTKEYFTSYVYEDRSASDIVASEESTSQMTL